MGNDVIGLDLSLFRWQAGEDLCDLNRAIVPDETNPDTSVALHCQTELCLASLRGANKRRSA